LVERLAADAELPLSRQQLGELLESPLELTGAAASQVQRFAEQVAEVADRHPAARGYAPDRLL
jgi:adenylosuccinate lyase